MSRDERRVRRYSRAVRRLVSAMRESSEGVVIPAGKVCSKEWRERSMLSRVVYKAARSAGVEDFS